MDSFISVEKNNSGDLKMQVSPDCCTLCVVLLIVIGIVKIARG